MSVNIYKMIDNDFQLKIFQAAIGKINSFKGMLPLAKEKNNCT